jgi:hypothetical protein
MLLCWIYVAGTRVDGRSACAEHRHDDRRRHRAGLRSWRWFRLPLRSRGCGPVEYRGRRRVRLHSTRYGTRRADQSGAVSWGLRLRGAEWQGVLWCVASASTYNDTRLTRGGRCPPPLRCTWLLLPGSVPLAFRNEIRDVSVQRRRSADNFVVFPYLDSVQQGDGGVHARPFLVVCCHKYTL